MTDGITPIKTSRPKWMDGAAEAGNVYFAEPEPPEPMTCADKLAVAAMAVMSVAISAAAFGWLYQTFFN